MKVFTWTLDTCISSNETVQCSSSSMARRGQLKIVAPGHGVVTARGKKQKERLVHGFLLQSLALLVLTHFLRKVSLCGIPLQSGTQGSQCHRLPEQLLTHMGQVKLDSVFSQLFTLVMFLAHRLLFQAYVTYKEQTCYVSKFLKQAHSAWGIGTKWEHLFVSLPQFPRCSLSIWDLV